MHIQSWIKELNINLLNTDVSRVASQKWQSESNELKLHFEKLADKKKIEHKLKYPNYEYRPTKKKPKSRRSKKKQSNLSDECITKIVEFTSLNSPLTQLDFSTVNCTINDSQFPSFTSTDFFEFDQITSIETNIFNSVSFSSEFELESAYPDVTIKFFRSYAK
ncbi:20008_t:CDS:2 [Gigaspora margarita]|uniref:20008_t:CDS:1 n=1 Tax=Gigaspora margarita TaxID=4874 RepID=A0ABN7WCL1_GIGMA|nr:20008_t:CDS:2 [Gigaspora margarita]